MPQMTEPLPTSRPREPCLHHGLLTGVPFQSPALLAEALCDRTNRSVLPPELVLLLVMTSKESSPCSARTGKTHRAAPRQRSCRYTPKSKPAFILVSELREATCLENHTHTHTHHSSNPTPNLVTQQLTSADVTPSTHQPQEGAGRSRAASLSKRSKGTFADRILRAL